MKSVRYIHFGTPEDVLKIEDLPIPEPGPDEVLIRLQARPINPSDLYQVMGLYGIKPKLPTTPGNEGAGVIERLGESVTMFKVGQKATPLKPSSGTWQEYVVAKAHQVIPVPDEMSFEAASMLIANPMSAYLMTRVLMQVPQGAWLLQTAAGSALGQMVIQLSKVYGFKTINVVRRREQVDELLALGADQVICTADEDVLDRVRVITDSRLVQYAIDAVAGETGTQVAASLGPSGTMVIYGALEASPVMLNPGAMIFKELTIRGFWLTRWLGLATDEQRKQVLADVMPLVMSGKVVSPIEARYSLDEIVAAVKHSQQPGRSGKILLVG